MPRITATSRPAPLSRPPATPLLEPVLLLFSDAQPALPLTTPPEPAGGRSAVDPELRQLAASLTSAIVDVLAGRRSPLQLETWVEPEVLNLVSHLRRARGVETLRLRSVRVQAPHREALEVAAHLGQGNDSRAAALRLSRRRGRWVATHLAIALQPNLVNQAGWLSPAPD